MMRQPSIFLSHGAPTFLLEESATTRFWQNLPALLPEKPRAILCVSAHWDRPHLSISGTAGPVGIQHDFYGFPQALYDINWDEKDDAETSAWLLDRFRQLDVAVVEEDWPRDHGLWVPLMKSWPSPDFPVYQLSLNLKNGLDSHWELGQRLSALRDEGVLLIGSGALTHNLRAVNWHAQEGEAEPWAATFMQQLEEAIETKNRAALINPWHLEYGKQAHPTIEHYVPLLFSMGAANGEEMKSIHRAWMYGTFALHSYGAGL